MKMSDIVTAGCVGIVVACGIVGMASGHSDGPKYVDQHGNALTRAELIEYGIVKPVPKRRAVRRTGVTLANFVALRNGMSYRQVANRFGRHGTETSRAGAGDYELVTYIWHGTGFSNVVVMFDNNGLTTKMQVGL